MSAHTPGPWSIGRICEGSGWVDIVKLEDGIKSLPFAACKHFDQEANARLIAAAPDLLAALESAVAYLEPRLQFAPNSNGAALLPSLRAAIAKATGAAL